MRLASFIIISIAATALGASTRQINARAVAKAVLAARRSVPGVTQDEESLLVRQVPDPACDPKNCAEVIAKEGCIEAAMNSLNDQALFECVSGGVTILTTCSACIENLAGYLSQWLDEISSDGWDLLQDFPGVPKQ